MFQVPNNNRVRNGKMGSDDSYGNNGAFIILYQGFEFYAIASDGEGWEHVSVTLNKRRTPTWDEMCYIKNLFWDKKDCVVQFHPPEKDYVNNHDFCLHLWRPVGKNIEVPDSILVGVK